MKWILGIALSASIAFNVYLVHDEVQNSWHEEMGRSINRSMGLGISKTKWTQGLKLFHDKLKEKNGALAGKKYYYINIWTTWCKPCIKEMPWLDSIANSLNRDVGYVFVSDVSDHVANSTLQKKNIHLKNFIFLNDMNDFISAICNEQGVRSKVYPMVLILSNQGEVLHYSIGAYSNKREASGFADLINKLE